MKLRDSELYLPVIHGTNGKDYVLDNDGGQGPMSTGTDEWGELTAYGRVKYFAREKTEDIVRNPQRGYGQIPDGILKVYLVGYIETNMSRAIIEQEEKRRALLKRLTAEEKELLGIKEK